MAQIVQQSPKGFRRGEQKVREAIDELIETLLYREAKGRDIGPEYISYSADMIFKNYIYCLGPVWSGFKSKDLLDKKVKPVDDHYHGRTKSAKQFLSFIRESIHEADREAVIDKAIALLMEARRVHRISPSEHKILTRIQIENPHLTPEQQYEMAGIELVDCLPTFIVKDTTYKGFTKAALQRQLGVSTYRFEKMLKSGEIVVENTRAASQ